MKAVIMAGGEGTRLRPLTSNTPKPMLPLVNRPMMEHIIDLLKRHGVDEIVVTVAFMANAIRNHFGDGSEYGVSMVTFIVASPRSRIAGGVESDGPKLPLPSLTKIATAAPITARSTRSSALNLPMATPLAPAVANC